MTTRLTTNAARDAGHTHYVTGSGYNIGPVQYIKDRRGRFHGVETGTLAQCRTKLEREGFTQITLEQYRAEFPQSVMHPSRYIYRLSVPASRNYPAYVAIKHIFARQRHAYSASTAHAGALDD